jgi:hypothetical protein
MKSRIAYIIFFSMLALIALSELLFSNLGTLNGGLQAAADLLGLTVRQERTRLLILIALDAIAGIGAVLAVIGLIARNSLATYGASMCAMGFLAYGIYQLFAALTQFGPAVRGPVALVGVLYAGVGIAAWVIGRRTSAIIRTAI